MFHKLTIDSIAARAVLVPMSRPLRTAAGDVPATPLVLVDVQTSEGIVGRSYAFAYTPLMLHTRFDRYTRRRGADAGGRRSRHPGADRDTRRDSGPRPHCDDGLLEFGRIRRDGVVGGLFFTG